MIKKVASIDLGTNTCLCLIAEWNTELKEVARVILDLAEVVRLGRGVDKNRRLSQEAMDRTLACLKNYSQAIAKSGVDSNSVIAVATSQARDAHNGAEFFALVERETGLKFSTLSGDEEARYTFLGGLLPGMDPTDCAVIDIGGGSTEFMVFGSALPGAGPQARAAAGAGVQLDGHSLDMGAVRYTERYLKSNPVTDHEFWECESAIDSMLDMLKPWSMRINRDTQLVGVAGTATSLAAWHLGLKKFDSEAINQVKLTRGDVHRMVEELKMRTIEERAQLPGVESGREDVLLAGAMILWRAMEQLQFASVQVSTRGLRFGVLNQLA